MERDEDFVARLGAPLTAHRLRRGSDLLLEATAAWLAETGPDVPARTLSTILLLDEEGPQGVTQLARRLRFTHPLMIELTRSLEAIGVVEAASDPKDGRRRVLSLTEKGRRAAEALRARLDSLDSFYRARSEEIGVDLLAAMDRLQAAARERPLLDRLREADTNG